MPVPSSSSNRLVYALCFVLFFSVMNATMFNVALPDIAADFALKPSAVSWTVTGYSVLYALGSLLFGKLADKYPLRRLITIGLLTFAAASAVGFFAESYPVVLAARFLQAAGASCVPALVMLIPIRFYPPERRGSVMGIIASTIAFSSGLGPIIGGFIAGQFHWTALFLISLAAPVALPFIRRALPDEASREGDRIDLYGAGLLGGGVTALMLSVTQWNVWLLAGAAVLAALFVYRSRSVPNPFVKLSLFRISAFTYGLTISFVALFAIFGMFLMTPIMLQHMHGLDPMQIGFVLFPAAMAAALLGRVGGGLVDRRGSRFTLYVAFGTMAVGMVALSSISGTIPWVIALALPLINVPFTFVQAAMAKSISSALPREQTGVGMGVYNLVNFLSGAISGAIVSKAVEFDWAGMNVTAAGEPSTYGTVYLFLALMIAANAWVVYAALERKPKAAESPRELQA